jgi:hypothetical protein
LHAPQDRSSISSLLHSKLRSLLRTVVQFASRYRRARRFTKKAQAAHRLALVAHDQPVTIVLEQLGDLASQVLFAGAHRGVSEVQMRR